MVIEMKIYLDLVFFVNFFFDFIILLATKLILKEVVPLWRIFLGSLVASSSIFLLFLSLSSFELFLIKVVVSVFIILVTFGRRNFLSDILYFYLISMILGGFLYFYVKQNRKYKSEISVTHSVEIYVDDKVFLLKGMLDTGNQLRDPCTGKSVILVDSKVSIPMSKFFYVPYKALNTEGVIPCCKVERVIVDDHVFSKCLIGISKDSFSLNGVDCILPNQFKEEL